jgi:hypothetical protein
VTVMGDWVGSDGFHSARPRGVQRVAALPARALHCRVLTATIGLKNILKCRENYSNLAFKRCFRLRRALIALSLAPIVDVSASMSRPRQQLDEDNDQGSTNTDTITTEGPTHHSQRSLLELLSQLWSLQCQAMIHYNRGDFD